MPPSSPDKKAAPETAQSELDEFKKALAENKAKDALSLWKKLKPDEKTSFKGDAATVLNMLKVLKKDAAKLMQEIGVDFATDPRFPIEVLAQGQGGAEGWMKAMTAASLWEGFVKAPPSHGALTKPDVQALGGYVDKAADDAQAKKVFEKVYVPLNDTGTAKEKVASWTKAYIKKLYHALEYIPVGQAQTMTGGITLVDQVQDSAGTWTVLKYGWWEDRTGRVVLPKASADNDSLIGETVVAGKQLSHFADTGLHEVGHGVGAKMGLDPWAEKHAGFEKVAFGDWVTKMWDDTKAKESAKQLKEDHDRQKAEKDKFDAEQKKGGGGGKPSKAPGVIPLLAEAEIQAWLGWQFSQQAYTSPSGTPDADYKKVVEGYYKDQPMWQYLSFIKTSGDDYNWTSSERFKGDEVYVYLKRWAGANFGKYPKKLVDNRVSEYSLASPREWFAEQYTHFYRNNKSDPSGRMDAEMVKKLTEVDALQYNPATSKTEAATVAHGAAAGGSTGGSRREESSPEPKVAMAADRRRLPFPW
jgi:hypothetical protein